MILKRLVFKFYSRKKLRQITVKLESIPFGKSKNLENSYLSARGKVCEIMSGSTLASGVHFIPATVLHMGLEG